MQSTTGKLTVAFVTLVMAVVLFLVLRNHDHTSTEISEPLTSSGGSGGPAKQAQQPAAPTIVIKGGEPVGGPAELEISKGGRIRFTVKSDVDEEVHLHGYDVSKPVRAGGQVSFDVAADIDGVFEAELEQSAVEIAEITVNP